MNQSLSALLANVGKPVKHHNINTRLSDSDFFALEAFCTRTYASYSEVIRAALSQYLKSK